MRVTVMYLLTSLVISLSVGMLYMYSLRSCPLEKEASEKKALLQELKEVIEHTNTMAEIRYNGFTPARDCIPIVLYVWNRPKFFNMTLNALRAVYGISETVLVITHDGYSDGVMQLVRQIDFMPVIDLIRPLSGRHEASFENLKHMWWWTVTTAFRSRHKFHQMGSSGEILFLEEDHTISPDAYRTLQWMVAQKNALTNPPAPLWGCALGTWYRTVPSVDTEPRRSYEFDLVAGSSNRGYTFNITTFEALVAAEGEFFRFFEGWDWSFYHLMQVRALPQAYLAPRAPRLIEEGYYGLTQSGPEQHLRGLEPSALTRTQSTIAAFEQHAMLPTDVVVGPFPSDEKLRPPVGG